MNIVERQARQALSRALRPGETVRGFTLCEWDNGRRTTLAFASLAVSKGFFAWTDLRIFLIPLRVRDMQSMPFSQINDMWARSRNDFLTVKLDANLTMDLTLNDPTVTMQLLEFWSDYYKYAIELFKTEFRSKDFDRNVLEDVDKELAHGLPFEAAVRTVATNVYKITLHYSNDKSVANAGAGAALTIARSHPSGAAANASVD